MTPLDPPNLTVHAGECADPETHLAPCEACRVSAERLRRMTEVWKDIEPDASEIREARVRFLSRRGRRSRSRALPGVVAFAVLLAGAGALGAARVASKPPSDPPVATGTAEANEPAPPALAARKLVTGRALERAASPSRVDSRPPSPFAAAERPSERSARSVPSASTAERDVARPAPREARGPVEPVRAEPAEAWATAATAMRAGDYAAAERAFGELARSNDPRTRDEARLARAQVLMAEGRTGQARAELSDLAASGATSLVRSRAAEGLQTASQRQPSAPGFGN
jgi:hypothetical protein